jgi:hypothetical protein
LFISAVAHASSPSDDATASTPQVSTGVVPPQVLNSLDIGSSALTSHALPAGSLVELSYTVDESGHPRDVQIIKGVDAYWNARIVGAVLNLRYKPATMDHQPVSMDVKLNVNIN